MYSSWKDFFPCEEYEAFWVDCQWNAENTHITICFLVGWSQGVMHLWNQLHPWYLYYASFIAPASSVSLDYRIFHRIVGILSILSTVGKQFSICIMLNSLSKLFQLTFKHSQNQSTSKFSLNLSSGGRGEVRVGGEEEEESKMWTSKENFLNKFWVRIQHLNPNSTFLQLNIGAA